MDYLLGVVFTVNCEYLLKRTGKCQTQNFLVREDEPSEYHVTIRRADQQLQTEVAEVFRGSLK